MMPSDFTSLFVDLAGLRTMLADVESLDFDAQPRNLTSIVQTHIMISTSFTFLPFYYRAVHYGDFTQQKLALHACCDTCKL